MTTEPSPKRLDVLIEVGKEKTPFYAHKAFLCNVSTFFMAALEGGFKEAESQKIGLPEDPPETVELFMEWLYTLEYKGLNEELLKKPDTAGPEMRRAMNLFIFADKTGTQSLKRQIPHKHFTPGLKNGLRAVPHISQVVTLYQQTISTCALRRLWIALHVCGLNHSSKVIDSGFHDFRDAALECEELAADVTCEQLVRFYGKKLNPLKGAVKYFYEPAMLEK